MRAKAIVQMGACLALAVAVNPATSNAADRLTVGKAAEWADSQVGAVVHSGRASAALVAVVSGGQILIAKAYGAFDPIRGTPVSVDTDQVIVASITKTVTATALAQLVVTRRIQSLDDPVNRYLRRFQLPAFNGREVTLRDLATHAGGLDSPGWGTGVHDQSAIPASGPYLAAKIPHLVREPGRLAVYANFGPPIIGAVIEDVSGERFDRYVARHILAPLRMGHSVINYAVDGGPRLIHAGLVGSKTPALALRMTNVPYAAPAGSLQATAPDMARYMLGHLGHIPEVIGPDLIALMQSPQHQNYPGLGRIGLSFFLSTWNGSPVVAHSGNIEGFKSNLVLVPTRDLGVFVSFVGSPVNGAVEARPDDATDSLLSSVLGPPQPMPSIAPTVDPRSLAGRYWSDLRAHGTRESLYYWDATTKVSAAPGGGLLVGNEGAPGERYVEVAPRVFQGPVRKGKRATLLAFSDEKVIRDSMYSSRVAGFDDPRLLAEFALGATITTLSGLAGFLASEKSKWLTILAGLAALVVAAAWLWPNFTHADFNPEVIGGDGRRLLWLRGAAWTFLADGPALLAVVGLKASKRGRVFTGWSAHQFVVALSSLSLAYIAFKFCLF